MPSWRDTVPLLSRTGLLIAGTVPVLAAFSLALALARPDEPRATVVVSAEKKRGPSGPGLAALVDRRLESPELSGYLSEAWGRTWHRDGRPLLRSGTTVEEPTKSARRVEIGFRGPMPERSVRLARLVAAGITETTASASRTRAEGEAQLAEVRRRLADPALGAARRRALRREAGYIQNALPGLRGQPALKGRLLSRQPGASETLTSILPGDDPPRPSPPWAALAGGLAAGLCWLLWLLLRPGPPRESARAAEPRGRESHLQVEPEDRWTK
jgi:hypothetical protein